MSEVHGQDHIRRFRLESDQLRTRTTQAVQTATEYSNLLANVIQQSEEEQQAWIENTRFSLTGRKYEYSVRSLQVQQAANAVGLQRAATQQIVTRGPLQQDQPELSKTQQRSLELEKSVMLQEAKLKDQRTQRLAMPTLHGEDFAEEKTLFKTKLEAIEVGLKVALEDKTLTEKQKIELKIKAMTDRRDAQDEFAHLVPHAISLHRKTLHEKEKTILKIRDLKKDLEILEMREQGREKEADREKSTKSRHARYEFYRELRPIPPDTSLSKEDVTYVNALTGKTMINKGRATMGGTKPMYTYEEVQGGKVWLYKEAVTCVGGPTPHRAYVTEGASKLQRYLCGENHYVPVFVAKNTRGEAIGTFQERVDTLKNPTAQIPRIDLFQWQENPTTALGDAVTRQILREHTLDWVLGNFDTKGENFLQKADGSLVSIDKEASFSHLGKKKARHMSRTEKLHKNDTIYNVLFTQFVEREVNSTDPLLLDFDSVEEQVLKMEALSNEEYLALFDGYLTAKAGQKSSPLNGVNKDRDKMEAQILERKTGLRDEYRTFFSQLLAERLKFIAGREPALSDFLQKYAGSYAFEEGKLKYKFPSERTAPVQQPQQQAVPAEQTHYQKAIRSKIGKFNSLDTVDPRNLYLNDVYKPDTAHFARMAEGDKLLLESSPAEQMEKSDKAWLERARTIRDAYDVGGSEGDGVNAVYHSYYSVMVSYAEEGKRKDVEGTDRKAHAESYGSSADDAAAEQLWKDDLENLLGNLKKDLAMHYATRPVGTTDPSGLPRQLNADQERAVLTEKANLKYLGANYLSMMETGFRMAAGQDYTAPAQATQKKNSLLSAQVMAGYTQFFKTGFSDLGVYAQLKVEAEALHMAKNLLEEENRKWREGHPGDNAYLKKMLRELEQRLNGTEDNPGALSRLTTASKAVFGDAFQDLKTAEAARHTSIGSVMNLVLHDRMLSKKTDLLRISEELQQFDKIQLKTPQQQADYLAKIEELKKKVLGDGTFDAIDLNYGSETFCIAKRLSVGESITEDQLPGAGEEGEQMTTAVKTLASKGLFRIRDNMSPYEILLTTTIWLRNYISDHPMDEKLPKEDTDAILDAEYVIQLAERLKRNHAALAAGPQ